MRPVELYTIALGIITPWRLNNSVDSIGLSGVGTFTSQPGLSRGDITDGEGSLDITLPASCAYPQYYRNIPPGLTTTVTVQWLDRDENPESLRVIYKGMVKSVSNSKDGKAATLHLESIIVSFDKELPDETFSPQCQNFLYDTLCGVNRNNAANHFDGTVSVVSGSIVTVSGLLVAKGAGWALPGYVAHAGSADYRQILAQDGDDLRLILPFTVDMVDEDVVVYAGCDHTHATCISKFGTTGSDDGKNYRGCPWIPTKNIFQTGIK
jgi:hypothetical protein